MTDDDMCVLCRSTRGEHQAGTNGCPVGLNTDGTTLYGPMRFTFEQKSVPTTSWVDPYFDWSITWRNAYEGDTAWMVECVSAMSPGEMQDFATALLAAAATHPTGEPR